jgi:D-alanine-D-alanine ligase
MYKRKTQMKNILILGGGKSLEHEVSLVSAKNILQNISKEKYCPYFVGLTKSGKSVAGDDPILEKGISEAKLNPNLKAVYLEEFLQKKKIDVVFPVLHGSYGEDGAIQGLLEILDIAYVGSDAKASAICMDKSLTKILLEKVKITTANYKIFFPTQDPPKYQLLQTELQTTKIVLKAAAQGSSVGVYICKNQQEIDESWDKLRIIGDKILAEEFVAGRELEIAILGNEKPQASLVGEILLKQYDFYSYEAKYLSEKGVELLAPTNLEQNILKKIQETALKAYKQIECSGMARIDFFLTKEKIYLNEINSIPGFTKISMYPKLWQASGINYSDLISKLIELAIVKKSISQKISSKKIPFHLF